MKNPFLFGLLAGMLPVHADVTYVDAVHGALGNTYASEGALEDTTWINFTDSSDEDQDQWRLRTGTSRGVGDTIFHARDNGSQDGIDTIPELTIELPGLADGTYNIYVFFWDDPGSPNNTQNIDAALTSGSLTTYGAETPLANGESATLAPLASTLDYSGLDPSTATLFSTWELRAAYVGQAVVTGGSTIKVYVDHSQPATGLTSTAQIRSLFDGVGYELAGSTAASPLPDQIEGTLISIDPEAGWTWYTDQRAIIDGPRLIAGGVRGKDWFGSVGDIVGTQFDLATGQRSPFLLGPPPIKDPSNINSGDTAEDKDDHNTAAFLKLPDGRYLSAWSSHSENNQIHFRRSTNPGDATSWDPEILYERSVADGASGPNDVTYNDLIFLSAEGTGQGRIYNFFRNDLADSWDRWFVYSDDLGVTWNWGGRHTGQNDPGIRPYPKYATNGVDTIWWVSSEDNSGQNIWSGYIKNGANHQMDGTVVDADIFDNTAAAVGAYTAVMLSGTLDDGTPMSLLWPRDLEFDSAGRLAATWRGYGNGSNTDIRQFYGRWNAGSGTWMVHRLGFTGDFSVTVQQDGSTPHTGTPLSAINPKDADVCFFSANVDPATGAPLVSAADGRRNFEIFRAETSDGGATWTYTQITRDSSCHNFRLSVIPWDENNTAVMWMRGYYDKWYFNTDNNGWDTALVAWLDRTGETSDPFLRYTDADLSNTTLANGSVLTTYTTGTGAGADDNQWNLRTSPSLGNNGTLFTANELSPYAEDCPVLKTTVSGVGPGTYDVFACFWSPRGNDFDVMAGLSEASLAYLERQSSQHAAVTEFDTTVKTTDSSRHLYRGYVGRVTLAATGPVEVYVDQFANGGNSDNRTWFDGVALQRVGFADTDSDGDGRSDEDEVVAGTDLYDADSFLAPDSFTAPTGGPISLAISGQAGRIYQLHRSTDLESWTPVGDPTDPLAADAPVTLDDPAPPPVRAFYRISVTLP